MRLLLGLSVLLGVLSSCARSLPDTAVPVKTPLVPSRPLRLMWINSYAEDNYWSMEIRQGIHDVLTREGYVVETGTLIWQVVMMDVPQYSSLLELYPLADAIIEDIQAFEPDVVLVSDDEAAQTIIPRYSDANLPFVFCGLSSDPQSSDLIRSNVAGVLERLHPVQNLAIARAFVGGTGNYVILSDASTSGNFDAWEVYTALRAYEPEAENPGFWVTNHWELWQDIVLDSGDYDFILLINSNFVWDTGNQYVSQADLMAWMLENAPVPVFAMSQTAVREGAVAGLVPSGYSQGAIAAENVLRIVRGAHPTSIRTGASADNILVMNLAAASNWGLPIPVSFPLVARVYGALPPDLGRYSGHQGGR